MTAPPGISRTSDNGITGSRPKAETKRHVAGRVVRTMKAAGLEPHGWQVRSLVASVLANHEEPTDEQLTLALMAAPWFPKPRRRRYRIGEAGWRVAT